MHPLCLITAGLTIVLVAANTHAGDDRKKAQMQVEDYVAKLVGNKAGFKRIAAIDDEALKKLSPGSHGFGVLFPQYPIGIEPPAPLKVGNVIVIDKDGKLHPLADSAALEKYCKAHFPAATTEAEAVTTMRAWLKLAQHIHGDGFYQFDLGDKFLVDVNDAKKPAKIQGVAKVKPVGGNKGQIEATLTFAGDGKLASVKENVKLIEGIRPICQATKLLDADPIIRKMAERDLLVLGRTGEEYLMMQRAKASPELRSAIERVWRQILAEDR